MSVEMSYVEGVLLCSLSLLDMATVDYCIWYLWGGMYLQVTLASTPRNQRLAVILHSTFAKFP